MPDKGLCTRCTGTQQDAPLEGVHPLEQVPTAKDSHDLFDAFAVADGGEYWMGGDVLAADLAAASASGFKANGCSAPIPDRTSCMLNQDRVSPKPVSSDKYYPYYFDAIFSSTPHSGRGNECGTIDGSQLGFWLLYSPPSSAGVRPGSERSRSSDLFHDQKSLGLTTTVAETARPRRRTLALQPDPLCQKSTAIPNGEKRRWPGHRLLSLEASRDSLVGVLGGCPTPTEAQSYMEGMSFILTLLCARGNSDHADGVIHSKLLSRKNAGGTVIAPDATTAMPSDVSPASERDGCCGMSPVDTRSAGATQGCGISPLGASCSCQEGLRPYDMKRGSSHTECPCPCGKALHSPFPRPGMRMETEGPGTPTLHCAGLRELKGGLPPLQGSEVRHHACPRRLAGHVVVDNGLANGAEVTRTSSAPFPSVEAVTDGEIGAPSSIEGVCASRRKECALAAHAADAEVRANGSTFATGDTPVAMGVDGNKVLGTRRVSELWHAGNEHSSVGAGNVLAGEMQVSPVGAVLRCPTPQEVSFPTERILQRKQEDCRADSACGGATEMVHARGREAEGRTESADKTPDPSRVPSGWEASATTNRVRMLVLNDKTSENRSSPAERMSLRTDTTLEITRGREQACLFRVDEYLECAGSDKLYSVTLAELRRKFLSGVNVAVLVSGSESALPVGWRAVREVVWCIFRDVGDGCELFASAALVQHGLTQDLLSGCGRMTRTAVVSVPPLQPMLENVDYVKLSDARHFSSLLVRSLESACLGEAHAHGYIAVSVLLKQAKEGDVVLSSMLVVGGANSTNSPSEALWKDDSALQHLFGAAVGGSCFTVSVVSLSEHDDGLAQLMNSQREVPSFVNQPCVVGSMKQLIEKAKGEIAGCCDKDRHHPEKVSSLLEQVAFAESLIADPKGFMAKCGVKGLQGCYAKMSKEEHGARGRSATQQEFSAKLVAESRACDSARGNPSFWQQRAEVGSGEWREEQCIYSNGGAGAESTAMQLCTDDPESSTDKRTAVPVGGTADKPSVKHTTTISGRISEARSKGCLTHIAARCDTPPTTNGGGLPPITRPINANRAPPPHTSRCRSGQKPFSVPSSRDMLSPMGKCPSLGRSCQEAPPNPKPDTMQAGHASNAKRECCRTPTCELPAADPDTPTTQLALLTNPSSEVPLELTTTTLLSSPVSLPVGDTASTRYAGRFCASPRTPEFLHMEDQQRATLSEETVPSLGVRHQSFGSPNAQMTCVAYGSRPCPRSRAMDPGTEGVAMAKGQGGAGIPGGNKDEGTQDVKGSTYCASQHMLRTSSKVQTLLMLGQCPRLRTTAARANDVVLVGSDGGETEYVVDEIIEQLDDSGCVRSRLLRELRDVLLHGCNAAILSFGSHCSSVSPEVLRCVVRGVLGGLNGSARHQRKDNKGLLSLSIVHLRGEYAIDLLESGSVPRKFAIAISPIFGPCVHNVSFLPVSGPAGFDSMLTSALARAAGDECGGGLVLVLLVLKQEIKAEGDVVVSSLFASLAGENPDLYAAVLDRDHCAPRTLFHYALGGPCHTVALLSIGGNPVRSGWMLDMQQRLGCVVNRPIHRGSVVKFIAGIRNDLVPGLRKKPHGAGDLMPPNRILERLEEMVHDAELLLKDFEGNEPRAYLSDAELRQRDPCASIHLRQRGASVERVRSLVFFEQKLLSGGWVEVQGNTVLARTGGSVCRYDVDEVVPCEPDSGDNATPSSRLIGELVNKFMSGHCTAVLAADSRSSAVTPLLLRSIVHQVLCSMRVRQCDGAGVGVLLASIALVVNDVTVDLLAVDEASAFHRLEVETSPLPEHRLRGVSCHSVPTADVFDKLLAVAVDRAEPALCAEDPGIMTVSLRLTQHIDRPGHDVVISSFMATIVFDRISHYTGVLQRSPHEPAELFKLALGVPCYTVAVLGLSDEDEDVGHLLSVQAELSNVCNSTSHPTSTAQHTEELRRTLGVLSDTLRTERDEARRTQIRAEIARTEWLLQQGAALLRASPAS